MYTVDETGLMNNYAVEPTMYFASYPTVDQQQRYVLRAAIAALFVATTLFTAFAVS